MSQESTPNGRRPRMGGRRLVAHAVGNDSLAHDGIVGVGDVCGQASRDVHVPVRPRADGAGTGGRLGVLLHLAVLESVGGVLVVRQLLAGQGFGVDGGDIYGARRIEVGGDLVGVVNGDQVILAFCSGIVGVPFENPPY